MISVMLYLSTSVGRITICNALNLEGNHGQQRDKPPQRPEILQQVSLQWAAVAHARDGQILQPPRPAVACSLAPAGSLSHESRVNSSPPSIKTAVENEQLDPPGKRH